MSNIRKNPNINKQVIKDTYKLFNNKDYIFMWHEDNHEEEQEFWKKIDPDFYESIKNTFSNRISGYIVSAKFFVQNGHIDDYCKLEEELDNAGIQFGEVMESFIEVHEPFDNLVNKLKPNGINLFSESTFNDFLTKHNIPYTLNDFWYNH